MSANNKYSSFKKFYHKHLILCNVLLMIVVTIFLGFFSLFFIDIWTNHGNTTIVPEVRKKNFSEAVKTLQESNLDIEIADSIYDTSMAPGMVKEVWPRPGARVKPGRTVYLTINSFQPQKVTVSMPLTGVSSRQAQTYLESLNIKNIKIEYVPSNFPDLVEGAKYKGKNIVPGMQIPVNANVVLYVGNISQSSKSVPATEGLSKKEDVANSGDKDQPAKEVAPETTKSEPTQEAPSAPAPKSEPISNPDVFD